MALDMEGYKVLRRRVIVQALFDVPECPDSPEPGRACRRCEAQAVAEALDVLEAEGIPL